MSCCTGLLSSSISSSSKRGGPRQRAVLACENDARLRLHDCFSQSSNGQPSTLAHTTVDYLSNRQTKKRA
eukprot:9692215-Prorocentrum_lima.AAC.1